MALGGCAASGTDRHLAPLHTRIAAANGRTGSEMLGGFLVSSKPSFTNDQAGLVSWGVRPFWSHHEDTDGGSRTYTLAPLGFTRKQDGKTISYLLPVYALQAGPKADGSFQWSFVGLPGVMLRANSETGSELGWFPIIGRFEDFATFDELFFVLWPLYVYTERGEKVSRHFLFPVLGWTRGGGTNMTRLWPIFGTKSVEGRYERKFALWPIFNHQRNHLGGGGEEPETIWTVFPFYGHASRGTYRAHTLLWPFFGYSYDPRGGFRAFDAPWPLIRYQKGGANTSVERFRIWPLYGYVSADNMVAHTFLWPVGHYRKETYVGGDRTSLYLIPFWQRWDRTDNETGEASSWRKLWPLFQYERTGDWSRGSFPTLDPFWRNWLIDYHYGWLWKAFEWEEEGELRRERSWLGLWIREKDGGEDRRSLSMLWSNRTYRKDGLDVSETSLLLGLIRWRRTEGQGSEMMRPAFPGPGWPAERVPAPDEAAPGTDVPGPR
ncbi:MAG: hypothetical protein O7B99_10960 [Planctomycetota bacterium]|nr:hypothetical protein [Planctomycetota bacterium]